MHYAFIRELFSSPVATAICWTLIHSLWQGLFFALTTGLVLLATKNSSPSLRYHFLSVQFLLFIFVIIATFIFEWNNNISGILRDNITANAVTSIISYQNATAVTVSKYHLLDTILAFLSQHTATIVMIWFIVFFVKSIKIISSLFYIQRLCSNKTHRPSIYWEEKITELCKHLKITKTVRLLESEIIKVPAVFGHLKPVIFIPLGILSNLPPQQIEDVLLHELGHIRRSDYLFNMGQNIIETIFFFNPACLWISSMIRDERENCCDDIAIAQTKDKKQFIESLIRFRELYIYNHSTYVTAFPGTGNSFLNRIKRIAMNKNKSLNPAENVFLAISLIAIGTLIMAFSQPKDPQPPKPAATMVTVKSPVTPLPASAFTTAQRADTIPVAKKSAQTTESMRQLDKGDYSVIYSDIDKAAGKETVVLKTAGNEYKLVKQNGEVAYLVVNDEKIPQDKMSEYSELLKKINARLEIMRKEQEIRDKEQEVRDEEQRKRDAEQEVRNDEQKKRDSEQAIRDKEQEKRDAEQAIRDKQQDKINAEQEIRNQEQKKRDAEQAIRDKEQEIRNREQKKRDAEQAMRDKEQEKRDAEQKVRDAELKKLIDELVTDKIIKDKNATLSFTLTADEFIVNGEKQSPETLKKYKTKYINLVGGKFNFRYN